MKFKDLCEERYSVRNFLSREIEQEKIDYILECARLAPSAANKQPWLFYVVTDESVRLQLNSCYDRSWFAQAPLYIIVCVDISQSWKRVTSDGKDYAYVDAAIASEHIALAVSDLGLGTCWVCNFDPKRLKQVLNIQEDSIEPVTIFPIAYVDEQNSHKPVKLRKELVDIVRKI